MKTFVIGSIDFDYNEFGNIPTGEISAQLVDQHNEIDIQIRLSEDATRQIYQIALAEITQGWQRIVSNVGQIHESAGTPPYKLSMQMQKGNLADI